MKRFVGCLPVPLLAAVSWGVLFAWVRWVDGASVRDAARAATGFFLPLMVGLAVFLGVAVCVYNQRAVARLYRRHRASLPQARRGSIRTVRQAQARGVRGTFILDYRTLNGLVFVWWTKVDVRAEATADGIGVEAGKTVWDTVRNIDEMAAADTFTPWCERRCFDAERGGAVLICSTDGLLRAWRWARLRRVVTDVPVVYTDSCVQRMAAEFRSVA